MERQHIKNALYQQAIGGSGAEFPANESEFFLRWLAAGLTISSSGVIGIAVPPTFSISTLAGLPLASLVAGDLLIGTGANALARLADVAAGSVLASGGIGVAPAWATAPAFSGANLSSLNASQLTTGTVPDARVPGPVTQTTSVTGAQHNFDLNAHFVLLRCSGAAPDFTGFTVLSAQPSSGDRLIIENIDTTTNTVAVEHESGSSTATNRILCPSVSGQIIGAKGRMELVYDGTSNRWREQCVDPGAPFTPAYAAGDFTGSGSMTWAVDSGDVIGRQYQQNGQRIFANIDIRTSSVGGTPSTLLKITHPRAWNSTATINGVGIMSDNGGTLAATWAFASSTQLQFFKDFTAAANWTASTNTTRVTGPFQFYID